MAASLLLLHLSVFLLALIHRSAWNRNSRKFGQVFGSHLRPWRGTAQDLSKMLQSG
jgi:hypothetical protein